MQKNEEVKQFKTNIKVNKEMKKKAWEDKINGVAKDMKKTKEAFNFRIICSKFCKFLPLEQQRAKKFDARGNLFTKFAVIGEAEKRGEAAQVKERENYGNILLTRILVIFL